MSVNVGQTGQFKINTPSTSYHIDILRLGYYGGDGARKIAADIKPIGDAAADPAGVPDVLLDRADRLRQLDGVGVVDGAEPPRSPGSTSRIWSATTRRTPAATARSRSWCATTRAIRTSCVATSDATWEAYNDYGGNSLYTCTVACPPGNPLAYKARLRGLLQPAVRRRLHDRRRRVVSLVRRVPDDPIPRGERLRRQLRQRLRPGPQRRRCCSTTRSSSRAATTSTGRATSARTSRQRSTRGVNLAFFSGNEIFWKTRWAASAGRLEHPLPHADHLQGDALQRADRS